MSPEPVPTPEENARGPVRRAAGIWGIGPVSFALIVISAAVAIYSNLGGDALSVAPLFISEYGRDAALVEVRHGQLWRLVTPVFLHFGIFHLVFNMMWVKDLGTALERRHGAGGYLALSATLAIPSNVAQFCVGGPIFGGMSGVVYGWFGYVWLRAKLDPGCGFHMPVNLVYWMIGWFVACLVGIIPHVANTAHGVGLAAGAIVGVAGSLRSRQSRIGRGSRQFLSGSGDGE